MTWYCRGQNDGTVDGEFNAPFDGTLLGPELGAIDGNQI